MHFSLEHSLQILQTTPTTLAHLLQNLSSDWTTANEGPETWSPYDVIGHLIHGDRTDWLARAEVILSDKPASERKFVPFDRFAQFEESKGKTLQQLLEEFSVVRTQSLERLRSLNIRPEELGKTGIHPTFGEVSLSQLLSTWVVHDLDHLSQISRVMAKQYTDAVGPWIAFLKILRQ